VEAQPSAKLAAAQSNLTRIEAPRGWVPLDAAELWRRRELIGFLALRDIRLRYKQSLLGAGWAIAQPLLTMGVFSLLFGMLLGRQALPAPAGVPYSVSTFCALVPWQLFATALSASSDSLVANQHLISKVYFPRLIAPIAPVVAALPDFAVAFAVLIGMLLAAGIAPDWSLLAVPLFVALALFCALSVSLWLSAANALYRDVRFAIPFLIQIWMFASPIVYTAERVLAALPSWARALYVLNPMFVVAEGFRWALLDTAPPPIEAVASAIALCALTLVTGAYSFRRMERRIADAI
jgi:lipopolysaccharide transport system permease protein